MAIPTQTFGLKSTGTIDASDIPYKKYTLPSLSDTVGLTDPQTGAPVTARAIRTNVAGTLGLVDPAGNTTEEVVAAGELVLGLCNGVTNTETVTITASDITVYL